jgi:hypothetical protein
MRVASAKSGAAPADPTAATIESIARSAIARILLI